MTRPHPIRRADPPGRDGRRARGTLVLTQDSASLFSLAGWILHDSCARTPTGYGDGFCTQAFKALGQSIRLHVLPRDHPGEPADYRERDQDKGGDQPAKTLVQLGSNLTQVFVELAKPSFHALLPSRRAAVAVTATGCCCPMKQP